MSAHPTSLETPTQDGRRRSPRFQTPEPLAAPAKRKLQVEEEDEGDEPLPFLPGAHPRTPAAAPPPPAKPKRSGKKSKSLFTAPADFAFTAQQQYKDVSSSWDMHVQPVDAATQARIRGLMAELALDIPEETLNHILHARASTALDPTGNPYPVDSAGGGAGAGPTSSALTLTPEQVARLRALPRLGYACLNVNTRNWSPPVYTNRSCVLRTFDAKGIGYAAGLALENVKDLCALFLWNEVNGIRFMRLSSDMFPFAGMRYMNLTDLPNSEEIKDVLSKAGRIARTFSHRVTFHPSHFVKLASEDEGTVTRSIADLEFHSQILDAMGYLPASPENKLNIHIGGTYGNKEATMERFVANFGRLSENCKRRLTLENDDKAACYSVVDLVEGVSRKTNPPVPIVFDFHHHKFCTGGLSEREALLLAAQTWPPGVKPVVHWSETKPDPRSPGKERPAHSDYVFHEVDVSAVLSGVDVMVEAKAKELAVLRFKQMVVLGDLTPNEDDEVLREDGRTGGTGGAVEDEVADPEGDGIGED